MWLRCRLFVCAGYAAYNFRMTDRAAIPDQRGRFLRDLRIETVIGIYDWERGIRQTVSFDFEFPADIRRAAVVGAGTMGSGIAMACANAGITVRLTDADGKITYANDAFCKLSGYSREELLGQQHSIVNSGHHSKEFWRDMWKTIATESIL